MENKLKECRNPFNPEKILKFYNKESFMSYYGPDTIRITCPSITFSKEVKIIPYKVKQYDYRKVLTKRIISSHSENLKDAVSSYPEDMRFSRLDIELRCKYIQLFIVANSNQALIPDYLISTNQIVFDSILKFILKRLHKKGIRFITYKELFIAKEEYMVCHRKLRDPKLKEVVKPQYIKEVFQDGKPYLIDINAVINENIGNTSDWTINGSFQTQVSYMEKYPLLLKLSVDLTAFYYETKSSFHTLTIEDLPKALTKLDAVLSESGINVNWKKSYLTRIDIFHDIELENKTSSYFPSLEFLRMPYQRQTMCYTGESFYYQNKSRAIVLYDKNEQLSKFYGLSEEFKGKNILRIELRYYQYHINKHNLSINSLADNYPKVIELFNLEMTRLFNYECQKVIVNQADKHETLKSALKGINVKVNYWLSNIKWVAGLFNQFKSKQAILEHFDATHKSIKARCKIKTKFENIWRFIWKHNLSFMVVGNLSVLNELKEKSLIQM